MVSWCRRRQPNLSSLNVCDAYLWIYIVNRKKGRLDIRSIQILEEMTSGQAFGFLSDPGYYIFSVFISLYL